MQITCTHEAPFSSLLSRNGSCLPRQDILELEVDGMDQAVAYWQIYTIVRGQDGVRAACENTVHCSTSHHYDVPEFEFTKKTLILATLRDFCLSWPVKSICRVLPGPANSKSSSTQAHSVTLGRTQRFTGLC